MIVHVLPVGRRGVHMCCPSHSLHHTVMCRFATHRSATAECAFTTFTASLQQASICAAVYDISPSAAASASAATCHTDMNE